MKKHLLWLLVVLSTSNGWSQDSIPILSGRLLEDLLENNDEQAYDFFSIYDELQTYLKDPLNINTAQEEDLRVLQMLTDNQINEILNYRDQYGPFISKYELQTIPSLDFGTLSALLPLVTEGGERNTTSFQDVLTGGRSRLFLKWKSILQDRRGFNDSIGNYEGDPNHLFLRYDYTSGKALRAAITMEKDPGEAFFRGSNSNGFDYYSGFVHLRESVLGLNTLHLGDYTMSMGQGLILHNNFGGGKSAFVTNIKKGGRPIRPYSSVNEGNFFRGIAATHEFNSTLSLTAFYSTKNIDGTVATDSTIDTGFERFSSIIVDGFHRTPAEIAKENTVGQQNYGGILNYRNRNFSISLNHLQTSFTSSLEGRPFLYRRYTFSGDQLTNTSIDYSYRYLNFNIFGEVARSNNGGMAWVQGALIGLGRNTDLALVYRDYGRDYQVLNANAFSESTLPINERGFYMGLQYRPSNQIIISSYYDIWHHPWLRFRRDAPSSGKEALFKVEYIKKRTFNAYLQYRYEEKEINSTDENVIDRLVNTRQHRMRLHVSNRITKELEIRNRLEFSSFEGAEDRTYGYLLYQDVIYRPISKPYSFSMRYAIFDTDGFDTRIYAFENDILYEFSIPFFSNRGKRFYINWRHRLSRWLTGELRYENTTFDNINQIGTGGEQITGNGVSEIKAQLRFSF